MINYISILWKFTSNSLTATHSFFDRVGLPIWLFRKLGVHVIRALLLWGLPTLGPALGSVQNYLESQVAKKKTGRYTPKHTRIDWK